MLEGWGSEPEQRDLGAQVAFIRGPWISAPGLLSTTAGLTDSREPRTPRSSPRACWSWPALIGLSSLELTCSCWVGHTILASDDEPRRKPSPTTWEGWVGRERNTQHSWVCPVCGDLTATSPCPDHFQHLLNDSERALQDTFPSAFGELYTQNAKAFRDLYTELRLYYRGANLHLEDALAEFWARLLERLFRQLHPQLLLPDDYLDCLGKQAEPLRPFGDAPRELRLRATRAFVATRSFVQGLGVAGDVVRKVAQVRPAA